MSVRSASKPDGSKVIVYSRNTAPMTSSTAAACDDSNGTIAALPVTPRFYGADAACSRSPDLLVDEFDDLLDRPACGRRARAPRDEALGLTLEQLQLDLAPRLAVLHDEAVEVGAGMRDVAGALEVEHGGQLDPLAAFERLHRVALGHGLFGLPVLIVARQHPIHDLRIRWAALL